MTPFVLAIVLLSALIHAVWSVFIKGSENPLAFNLLQTLPLAGLFLPLLGLVDLSETTLRFWWLLAVTGVAHAFYLYWLSLAFERGDLSLVYPIARSTPAFLPLLAVPLLGEGITLLGASGIAIVVAGIWAVALASRTTAVPGRPLLDLRALLQPGLLFAYLALATTVAYGLSDKALMAELVAQPWTSPLPKALFAFFALWFSCALIFVPLALLRVERADLLRVARSEWRRASLAALISIAGYGLILKALESAEASYVVAVRQSSVIFVLIMSVVWLGERPGRLRVVGALATCAGVALIAVAA